MMEVIGIITAVAWLCVVGIIVFWIWAVRILVESVRRWSYAREKEAYAYSNWVDYKIYGERREYFNGDERDERDFERD